MVDCNTYQFGISVKTSMWKHDLRHDERNGSNFDCYRWVDVEYDGAVVFKYQSVWADVGQTQRPLILHCEINMRWFFLSKFSCQFQSKFLYESDCNGLCVDSNTSQVSQI